MKKLISCFMILALTLSVFAGCASTPAESTEASTEATTEATVAATASADLAAAREYLYTMYRKAPQTTPADYTVVGTVVIGTESYEVEWTADSETIKFVRGDDKMVTVDVDEANAEEVTYTLTATLTDAAGNTESVSFPHRVPAAIILPEGATDEEIVTAAYTLEEGLKIPEAQKLTGSIVSIDNEFNPKYGNITVTIQIGDLTENLIQCFRLGGEGAAELAVGDTITVEGILKNHEGTIEFDAGCTLVPAE